MTFSACLSPLARAVSTPCCQAWRASSGRSSLLSTVPSSCQAMVWPGLCAVDFCRCSKAFSRLSAFWRACPAACRSSYESQPFSIMFSITSGFMRPSVIKSAQPVYGASAAPVGGREQHQNGEQLEPAKHHGKAGQPFGDVVKLAVVGAGFAQRRAQVVDGRKHHRHRGRSEEHTSEL